MCNMSRRFKNGKQSQQLVIIVRVMTETFEWGGRVGQKIGRPDPYATLPTGESAESFLVMRLTQYCLWSPGDQRVMWWRCWKNGERGGGENQVMEIKNWFYLWKCNFTVVRCAYTMWYKLKQYGEVRFIIYYLFFFLGFSDTVWVRMTSNESWDAASYKWKLKLKKCSYGSSLKINRIFPRLIFFFSKYLINNRTKDFHQQHKI